MQKQNQSSAFPTIAVEREHQQKESQTMVEQVFIILRLIKVDSNVVEQSMGMDSQLQLHECSKDFLMEPCGPGEYLGVARGSMLA
jgi:hypothetical protein